MKTICITQVPMETEFIYDGETFEVTDRTNYPIIYGRCISNPDKYDGLVLCFWNFEKVEVNDDAKVYETYLEQTSKNHYQMKERLV